MSVSFSRRARYLTFAGLATVLIGAGAQFAVAPAAVSADAVTVPLHNTTTPNAGDCPDSPPQWGWHFIAPANSTFVSLSVTFAAAGTITLNDPGDFGPP